MSNAVVQLTGFEPELQSDDPTDGAQYLLGKTLVGRDGTAGIIIETEAYGPHDEASHSFRGTTPRTAPMFAEAGTLYVYFTYGVHWCFNVVTGSEGVGAAVLVRALRPVRGIDVMQHRRAITIERELCSGPAKLASALDLRGTDSGTHLDSAARYRRDASAGSHLDSAGSAQGVEQPISIMEDRQALAEAGIDPSAIRSGPRIGISRAQELNWRFALDCPGFVSRPSPARLESG